MTDEQIDQLIAVRNYQTNRRDELTDWAQVDSIDVLLRDVPPGQRNDVDLLLGRLCAVLPVRAALQAAAHEAGVTAEWTPAHTLTDAEYERMSACQPDGIVEHYASHTEGHW
jgi:hypothetical protein